MPEVTCTSLGDGMIEVVARGGSRNERFRAINKHVREHSHFGMVRYYTDHSETFGFLHATYARYQKES